MGVKLGRGLGIEVGIGVGVGVEIPPDPPPPQETKKNIIKIIFNFVLNIDLLIANPKKIKLHLSNYIILK